MTRAQKEKNRAIMMFIGLISVVIVMLLILLLGYLGVDVTKFNTMVTAFFVALAGVNGASFYTTPSWGSDDYKKIYEENEKKFEELNNRNEESIEDELVLKP